MTSLKAQSRQGGGKNAKESKKAGSGRNHRPLEKGVGNLISSEEETSRGGRSARPKGRSLPCLRGDQTTMGRLCLLLLLGAMLCWKETAAGGFVQFQPDREDLGEIRRSLFHTIGGQTTSIFDCLLKI